MLQGEQAAGPASLRTPWGEDKIKGQIRPNIYRRAIRKSGTDSSTECVEIQGEVVSNLKREI